MQTVEVRTSCASSGAALALLDYAETGLIALDGRGCIVLANAAARRLLGLGDVVGVSWEAALATGDGLCAEASGRLWALVRGRGDASVRVTGSDGSALVVSRRDEEDGTVLLSLRPGILAAREAGDALTGLSDRSGLQRCVAEMFAAAGCRIAVVKIDLTRFRLVTDSFGDAAGDALLKLFAQRLRGMFRTADVVSRIGGTEFAVAMTAGPELEPLMERLVSVLTRPYLVERHSAVIGVNVGIAFSPQHGSDAVGLIRAADIALSRAKADRLGAVCRYDDEMGAQVRSRHELTDDLRRALPLGQFELHYQPQVSLGDNGLTGFEALVRWRHPVRGLVGPDQFIPLAEETGLIVELGEWVLFEACRTAMQWPAHISVAVNVSSMQLLDRQRLPRMVAAALQTHGLSPSRLEIEVTESALLREAEAFEILTEIRRMGVRVSMDDFGTGYSSLSQLRRFPFDKLKIDRSFIRDLGDSGEADAVVRAIAALGRSLGMATIAEGVETEGQQEICRLDGCTSIQGYLVSKPVPSDAVPALIARLLID